jgi:acyl dehydratase
VVAEKRPESAEVVLTCELVNQDGEAKIAGEAVAALPKRG